MRVRRAATICLALFAGAVANAPVAAGEPHEARGRRLFTSAVVWQDDARYAMRLVVVDPETGTSQVLEERPALFTVTADGSRILFDRGDGGTWAWDWQGDAPPARLPVRGLPVLSPDGRSAFVTHVDERIRITPAKEVRREWSSDVRRFETKSWISREVEGLRNSVVADWSPDGKRLLVTRDDGDLLLVNPDGSDPKPLAKDVHSTPRFSPDGKHVAYTIGWQGRIRLVPTGGGPGWDVFRTTGIEHVMGVAWSPDGRYLATTLLDQEPQDDGPPLLPSDPKRTNPRLVIVDVDRGTHRIVRVPPVDGQRVEPQAMYGMAWR